MLKGWWWLQLLLLTLLLLQQAMNSKKLDSEYNLWSLTFKLMCQMLSSSEISSIWGPSLLFYAITICNVKTLTFLFSINPSVYMKQPWQEFSSSSCPCKDTAGEKKLHIFIQLSVCLLQVSHIKKPWGWRHAHHEIKYSFILYLHAQKINARPHICKCTIENTADWAQTTCKN